MTDNNEEIGTGTTTLDYLKVRYQWLGELIDETNAELERLRAENARLLELDKRADEVREVRDELVDRLLALEAENAELRDRRAALERAVAMGLGDCEKECEALKKRLAWLVKYNELKDILLEALMEHNEQSCNWIAYRELSRWRQANPDPKPAGEGT